MGKKTNTTAIGKKLEDEVADIYRQIDGVIKVIQNTNIEGIQVDVYVELESRDGVINRCAIDAKNYKKAVDSCRVRECINNFKLLRDKNKVDQGLVVAENGFAQDAHATAREISGFKLVDIKDLRQKAFNFSPYLEKWIQLYEGNEIFLKNLYIPLTAKKEEENKVVPLDNYLLEWLNEETTSHITLLGNYGTGKSTTLRRLMWNQAKKYLANPYVERIPIFVELKGYREAPKTKSLITDLLVNEIGVKIDFNKFGELNDKGRFLIMLDGFDEMVDRVLEGRPYELFNDLSSLASTNGKVVLSCRTHYFRDHNQVLDVHVQEDLLSLTQKRTNFEILFLNHFSEKDIDVYLQRFFYNEWTTYKATIEKTYDLKSLAEVPILLHMIVQTLPEILKNGEIVNRSTIYQTFTDKWLRRDQWRRSGLTSKDRLYFCKQIALHFYKTQENSVHWEQLPQFIKIYFSKYIKNIEDIDIFESDIRTCNFLTREEQGGKYSFVHKSFMEFFIARHFYDSIINKITNGLDDLKDFTKSRVIYDFLIEMVTDNDIKNIRNELYRKENESISQLMSHQKHSENRTYFSPESLGNITYIFLEKKVSLNGAFLDDAKLSGITLSNYSFEKTFLNNAQFDLCNLSEINFTEANLSNANFKSSNLKNVNFDKANIQGANFLNSIIDNITIDSLARSKYWGSIKIENKYRRKIEISREKAGELKDVIYQ